MSKTKEAIKNEIKNELKRIVRNQIKNVEICHNKSIDENLIEATPYFSGKIDGYMDVLNVIETVLI